MPWIAEPSGPKVLFTELPDNSYFSNDYEATEYFWKKVPGNRHLHFRCPTLNLVPTAPDAPGPITTPTYRCYPVTLTWRD